MKDVNSQTKLIMALNESDGNATYVMVSHIKIVMKQLMGHTDVGLENVQDGVLTDLTVKAMKCI